ncbi:hypothetical protein OFM36_39295, partial [Escherichia coli]|nr:hypothetical protein [Escherichia coli]
LDKKEWISQSEGKSSKKEERKIFFVPLLFYRTSTLRLLFLKQPFIAQLDAQRPQRRCKYNGKNRHRKYGFPTAKPHR